MFQKGYQTDFNFIKFILSNQIKFKTVSFSLHKKANVDLP